MVDETLESLHAVEQDRAAFKPLQQRRRDLQRQILARTWSTAGGGGAGRAASAAEVRATLTETGQTMVMFVQAGGGPWAVVAGAGMRLHELGPAVRVVELVRRVRADLDVLAQARLPAPLRAAIHASLGRSLAGLDSALIAALVLPSGPLVVVSTGVLGQLPGGRWPPFAGSRWSSCRPRRSGWHPPRRVAPDVNRR